MNTPLSRNFGSDNVTPVCAPIMAAINAANTGLLPSYGADEFTERLQRAASAVFEREVSIYPVATGTAANALALAQLVPPFGGIYCHEGAHIVTDECGAPELFTGGAKLLGLPSPDGKIGPEAIEASVALANDMGVHHVKPSAISVTQATELGTVYGLDELADLTAAAKRHGLPVHMDGARFANAVAHLGCSPAEATWKAGIDVLSFGASKNGALAAEAVVFFDPRRAEDFERRRKRAGHLWSKLRYLSCQLLAYLEGRSLAAQRPSGECDGCTARGRSREGAGREASAARSGQRAVRGRSREAHRGARERGISLLPLALAQSTERRGDPAGHELCNQPGGCGRLRSVRARCPSARRAQPWNISST